jgi:hypothetical protein
LKVRDVSWYDLQNPEAFSLPIDEKDGIPFSVDDIHVHLNWQRFIKTFPFVTDYSSLPNADLSRREE